MSSNSVPQSNLEFNLTLAQARAVVYHAPHRRPMGELLDEGLLTRSDLAWAAKTSYNERVKAAAHVLLAELDKANAAPPPL